MKSIFFYCLLLTIGQFTVKAQHTLTIEVSGAKKVKGKLGVCLLTEQSEFLSDCSDYIEIQVTDKEFSFRKTKIKSGIYAITMYHDMNDNGKLDTNFLGIPKERYGFSNNPRSTFGPPDYKKCLFEIKSDTTIKIRLK